MIQTIITLILINYICVEVIGRLNYPNEIASMIMNKMTNGRIKRVELIKPFSCPLCMTIIISMIYLCFVINWLSFTSIVMGVAMAVMNGVLTKYMDYLLRLIDGAVTKIMIICEKRLR